MADLQGQDLGAAPLPLGFDRERERQIAIAAEPSLFCVDVKLRSLKTDGEEFNPAAKAKYDKVGKAVRAQEKGQSKGVTIPYNTQERTSTGFAVATNGNRLRILTCAHVISDIYTKGMHGQFTLEEVNQIFSFKVHCVHQELEIRAMENDLMISERKRNSTPAEVVALDTELDLLVLETDAEELTVREETEDDGTFQIRCEEGHPLIQFANENLNKLQKLVLVGWPPQKSGACVTGQVSHPDWTYDAITSLNIKGYNMTLLEVSGMAGDCGFSGAPVMNAEVVNAEGHVEGRCVGVFHGVFNLINGYVISLGDVNEFLNRHNMFVFQPPQPGQN